MAFWAKLKSGRVADRVGEDAGLDDRAQEGGHAAVVAAQLEDLLGDRAVLALELARLDPGQLLVGAFLDLDAQAAGGVGVRRAGDAAVEAAQLRRAGAAGQADGVGHLGDGADLGVFALVDGDEQHARLVAHVDGQGHGHVREDDDVFQRDEQE